MSSIHILRKAFVFSLAILLTAAVFTGCGEKNEKTEDKDTKKTETAGMEDLRKGKAAYEIEDYHAAAMSFSLAAQDGNAEAQFLLGKCYLDGTGVEQNFDKAMKWLKMAVDQGVAEAKTIISDYNTRSNLIFENGYIILSGNLKLNLVKVEAGTFTMSAKDGENSSPKTPHRATLTKDFYIGQTEVTQAQWKAVMGTDPSNFKGDDLPVEQVSWNEAMEFCEKLNKSCKAPMGWKFTLPTETQWEFAARGGKKSANFQYSGSDGVDNVAWCYENSGDRRLDYWDPPKLTSNHCTPHPVAQKRANELGLYDMSGNVSEWCLDDMNDDSSKQKAEFTRGNDQGGKKRMRRGGSWRDVSFWCRSTYRLGSYSNPDNRFKDLGFRVALVPESY